MRFFWSVTAVACALSVLSARLADAFLDGRIAILGRFAGLQYSLNPGIAWGIRLPQGIQEAAICLALIAVIYLAYKERGHKAGCAYAFIVGGGLGNIIDRLPDGYVTDYFQVGTFPIFNVADSFVSVGVAMLLWFSLPRKTA